MKLYDCFRVTARYLDTGRRFHDTMCAGSEEEALEMFRDCYSCEQAYVVETVEKRKATFNMVNLRCCPEDLVSRYYDFAVYCEWREQEGRYLVSVWEPSGPDDGEEFAYRGLSLVYSLEETFRDPGEAVMAGVAYLQRYMEDLRKGA